jgi:uncharacterized RDD family membrane protein YckC
VNPLFLLAVVVLAGALAWAQIRADKRPAPTVARPVSEPGLPPPDIAVVSPSEQPPWFATFPRRLNALTIDGLVVLAFSGAVFGAMPLLENHPPVNGILLFMILAVAVLYEPVQVATFGSTVGHRAMNLRVVDDETRGNPTLFRALLRALCKGLFGLLAFTTMGASRRHRAVHDMFTATTVQIRNRERARPHQYVLERPPRSSPRAA